MFILKKKRNDAQDAEYMDSAIATSAIAEATETTTENDNIEQDPDDVKPDEAEPDVEGTEESTSDYGREMLSAFEAWLGDSGIDPEARESALEAMTKISESVNSGEFDDMIFDLIAKGSDYERAVEEAAVEGELKGRNASIDELKNRICDDGLPHLGACGGSPVISRTPSIFDLARGAH